jgi:hypothetical protein
MSGSIRNSPITKILVDPVNNGVGLNVFTGVPADNVTQIAVAITDWSAITVVPTQDSADGLISGSTQPSYGIQLGWMDSGTFVAVDSTNPLPVTSGGGGGGTQYAEGNTTTPATGTVALGRISSSGVLLALQLDNSDNLKVAVENTVTVSGTVAATQSGTWNIGTVTTITNPVTVTGTVAATQSGTWFVQTIPAAPTTSLYTQAAISFNASGANTVVAGSSGKTIRIYRIFFVNADGSTTTQITIKDSTPTSFSGAFPLIPAGSFSGDGNGDPLFITASGKGFVINSSAAVQISGTVWYTIS